jgi:hypothetical protein
MAAIRLFLWTITFQFGAWFRVFRGSRLLAKTVLFDRTYYLEENPDVRKSGLDPVAHYVNRGWIEERNPHPLFDSSWYLKQNGDVAAARVNPLVHYLRNGWKEGRNPHPLFDTTFYIAENPDVDWKSTSPLEHYVTSGSSRQRDPHPLFNSVWYLQHTSAIGTPGVTLLEHYLRGGWHDGHTPHQLFDSAFYLQRNRDVDAAGINPLLHYVNDGAREGRDPNPLFDTAYYLRKYPEAGRAGVNPLIHYLVSSRTDFISPSPLLDVSFYLQTCPDARTSAMDFLSDYLNRSHGQSPSPHPLFDVSYYLERNPRVAAEGLAPLYHYVTRGASEACNPNPLFDTAFYLARNQDVALSGMNPLVHYITAGAFEGRLPNPFFDSAFYLKRNPDVKRAELNPLAHYLCGGGAEEARDPSAFFSTSAYVAEHPEIAGSGINPLAHFLGHRRKPTEIHAPQFISDRPACTFKVRILQPTNSLDAAFKPQSSSHAVLCVSHVFPYPPRAGNQYRIYRMLRWIKLKGFRVFLIFSPLGRELVSDEAIRGVASEFDCTVVCNRDGIITCCASQGGDAIVTLDGLRVPSYAYGLGEECSDRRSLELVNLDRAFCPDALIAVSLTLAASLGQCAVLVEHISMSRLLPLLNAQVLKIIDTIDVFSRKQEKSFDITNGLSLSSQEVRERLLRGDLILAIQPEEQKELEKLVAPRKVITVGVDFSSVGPESASSGQTILYVASDNPMNTLGLQDFLRFVWPRVLSDVPKAKLVVAGDICNSVFYPARNIVLLGTVSDVAPLYEQARVVINPVAAGTGLKIGMIEALNRMRPVVTWPGGVEGLDPRLASLCRIAGDWHEFHHELIEVLDGSRTSNFDEANQSAIRTLLSSAVVYRDFEHELDLFFSHPEAVIASASAN